jgi:hyperosmotically inducible periplasmic protein
MRSTRDLARQTVAKLALAVTALMLLGALVMAQQTAPAADNTKVNAKDRTQSEPTADQQKETPSDRDLTQQIRKALMSDKTLSTYGHNVKIITQDGMVTLKGPVRSAAEKTAIEAKATEIAGEHKVTSELSIKAKQ